MFETSPNLNSQDLSELSSHHEALGMVRVLLLMIFRDFWHICCPVIKLLDAEHLRTAELQLILGRCPNIICIDNRIHSAVTRKEKFLCF